MKCITIHQAWASLWASGLKTHETRGWWTAHRGLTAVHAGKTWDEDYGDEWMRSLGFDWLCPLEYGAIVGVVNLVDCKRTSDKTRGVLPWVRVLDETERSFGDFSPGRYGWEAKDARLFNVAIPMRGQQGLFDLSPEFEAKVREQLKGGA